MGLGQYNSLGEYCCPHTASSVFLILVCPDLLVLYLVVEVAGEPIVEPGWLDVAGGCRLLGQPIIVALFVDLHRQMTHLGDKGEPETLQYPVGKK